MVSMVSFLLVFVLIVKKKKKSLFKLFLNCSKIADVQDCVFIGKWKAVDITAYNP